MDRNELRFLNETWNWLQWIVQIRGIVSIVKFRINRINGYPIKFISLYSMIMMNRQHTCISMVLDISFMKKECWQKSIVLYPRGLTKFGETKFIYLFDIITNFQSPISNEASVGPHKHLLDVDGLSWSERPLPKQRV